MNIFLSPELIVFKLPFSPGTRRNAIRPIWPAVKRLMVQLQSDEFRAAGASELPLVIIVLLFQLRFFFGC